MPDQLQFDSSAVMSPQDVSLLMNQTKMQLVSQYPQLATNTDFNNELSDAVSKFVNRGVQIGSDYNTAYNQTIAPFAAKWSAKGAQDTAKIDLAASQVAKDTGSPTAAVQQYPQLLAPNSPYRANWQSRIAQEDKANAGKPRLSLAQTDAHSALQKQLDNALANSSDPSTDEKVGAASKALMDFDNSVTAQLAPPNQLRPQTAAAPPAMSAPIAQPVAAPMGTSGYVNYNTPAAMRPQGQIFMGNPTPAQAAALLQQWQMRGGAPLTPSAQAAGQTAPAPAPAPKLTPPNQIIFTDPQGNQTTAPPLPAANIQQLQQAAKAQAQVVPKAPQAGTPATPDIIRQALAQANGDKDAARKLLTANGYTIPQAQ
jgi:hypothetical protein